MSGSRRRLLTRALRVTVTAAFVVWIVRSVEWGEFAARVADAKLAWVGLAILFSPVLIWVSTLRWRVLLRARELDPGGAPAFRLYLSAYFFNHLFPSGVGGDLARGYLLGARQGRTAEALASVIIERFLGGTALLVLALGFVPLAEGGLYGGLVRWALAGAGAVYVALLWLVVDRSLAGRLRPVLPGTLTEKLERLQAALAAYRGHPGPLAGALGLSFLFYVGAGLNVFVAARAFGSTIGPVEAILATPVALVVALLPITVGGLGLAEWAYMFALGHYGVSPAVALSAALLLRVKGVAVGAIGGLDLVLRGETETLGRPVRNGWAELRRLAGDRRGPG